MSVGKQYWLYVMLLGIELLRSGQHVLLKLASQKTNPFCIAFVRDIFATLSLLGYVWFSGVSIRVVKSRDIPRMFLLGLCGVFFNQLLFLLGLQSSTPASASIMQALVPIWTCLLTVVFGVEPGAFDGLYGATKLIGVFFASIGSLIMLLLRDHELRFNTAVLYFLFNTLSMALFLVLQRPLLSSYPPAVIAFCSYFNATLLMTFVAMPIAYASGVVEAGDMLNLSEISWFTIAYSGIITSAFVFYATFWSSKRTSSIVVAGFFAVQMLSTTLLSAAVLSTPIANLEILTSLPILLGLSLVCWATQQQNTALCSLLQVDGESSTSTLRRPLLQQQREVDVVNLLKLDPVDFGKMPILEIPIDAMSA